MKEECILLFVKLLWNYIIYKWYYSYDIHIGKYF